MTDQQTSPASAEETRTGAGSEFTFFHPRFWNAAAALWTAAVLALALTPDAKSGWLMKTLGDKVLHGFAFAVGCFLWAKALQASSRIPRMTAALAGAFIALVIGLAVEVFQAYIPERSADPQDIVADVLGVLPALALLTLLEHLHRRRKT